MKTSMLGEARRRELAGAWPEVAARGVADEGGGPLFPGDLVRLPASVRWGDGADWDVAGTVAGFALGKDGSPSVVVHAPAWSGGRPDPWRTYIVNGDFCNSIGEAEASSLVSEASRHGLGGADVPDGEVRSSMAAAWMGVVLGGVLTKGGVAIRPGDLVRLPRNVARNRGSQLHAAGMAMGYAIGLDGSACVAADAVGEDVPTLTRWRTWLARGIECLVIDAKEAWRLEQMYLPGGYLRPKGRKQRAGA